MNRFEYARAESVAQARELRDEKAGSVLKAGGIDLVDHLKEHLVEPPRLVDIRRIDELRRITATPEGGLRLGPLATLAQVAAHVDVRRLHPALAGACGTAASPQVRNVATIGGNLLQRPRCWYYRLESYPCLKKGGDTCFAAVGENRYHAILGGGPCWAVHPSNAAIALVATDARLVVEGRGGRRTLAAAEFFTVPDVDVQRENVLAPDEVLVEIQVPPSAGLVSAWDEVRERAAFDWPLASAAVAVRRDGGIVRDARVVLGHVATVPWRATGAEKVLVGRKLDDAAATEAGRAAVAGAEPLSDNAYKVQLVPVLVRRALLGMA